MNEGPEEITVKVKYDPNKDDTIDVKISPNATVSDLEEKVQDKLENCNNVLMGILKFNGKELDDKGKTLEELGIKDGSSVENENRVVWIRPFTGKTIYITCDENTTVKQFLEKLKGKYSGWRWISLSFSGSSLQRSELNLNLFSDKGNSSSIAYGSTLDLVIVSPEYKNGNDVFDLNNLNSNYPLLRIIVGIADLLLLAAAITTFLLYFLTTLSLSIAVPIVLTVLFVAGAVLFFGWNKILPKILPDNCLKKPNLENTLDEKNKDKIKETENDKEDNPEKKDEKEEEEENDSL